MNIIAGMEIMRILLVVTLLTIAAIPTHGLMGYDCGGGGLNVTTYSTLEVEQCNIPVITPNETNVKIQLLQLTKYQSIKVQECRVTVERSVFRCGMWSHVSAVKDHQRTYFVNIDREQCKMLIATGTYKYTDTIIMTNLKPNSSNQEAFMLAGNVDREGTCEGATYSDKYRRYEKVVVEGLMDVQFRQYEALIDIETNKVKVRGGGECPSSDG